MKSKCQTCQRLSFLLNQSTHYLLSPILSLMCVKENINQLRGALQNRGPQQGQVFTSTQKVHLFPVRKYHPMFQIWFWEGVAKFKHLCTFDSKLNLRNRSAFCCLLFHLLQEFSILSPHVLNKIWRRYPNSNYLNFLINIANTKLKQNPLEHRKQNRISPGKTRLNTMQTLIMLCLKG